MENNYLGGYYDEKSAFSIFFSVLLFASFPNQTKAEETGPSKELTELIIQEAEPTIDLDSLSNLANTDYSPNSLSNGNESVITPYGLTFARGTVGCYVISKSAYCPWTIQVGGDVIAYSNVKVTIQKHHGFLKGGWKNYKTHNFSYPINRPTSTIRNELSDRLSAGKYRANLGGTFRTAIANGYSYFEVK
ncbi:hypothetical protein FC678_24255 [Peribacillus simplex]|uniref:Uncharacterized protein n=1 Tax=Peribacillus simplex TaxID=1478 RepID=A0A9X8ZCS5_9BACI|nr:hypothetical protein [Peribacillus simplex]TKH05304.1 hypothetical protein FC678_24255 [Peribacillus simplex]